MKKLLRKIMWRIYIKNEFIRITQNNPFGYPLIMFIEFEGEELYITHGFENYKKLLINKLDEIVDNISNSLKQVFDEQDRIHNMSEEEWLKYQDEIWDEFDTKEREEREREIEKEIRKIDLLIKQQLYN